MNAPEIVDAGQESGNPAVTPAASSLTPLTPLAPQRRRRADRAREIADVLRQQIVYGALREATLPMETALAREFGASRNTVREALSLLRDEGLVERVPGIGTFVVCEKYPHGLNALLGLGETLVGHGRVSNEIRSAGSVTAPPAVARRLGLAEPTRVGYLERLRSLNGLVLSLDLTYLHPDIADAVLAEDLAGTDVFVLIERLCGRRLGAAAISVEAVNADPHSAALLQVPEGAALLMVERLAHLEDGRPVDLEYIRFRGDRVRMDGRLARPNTATGNEDPCH
jgi:GntR family transcriptional regulator